MKNELFAKSWWVWTFLVVCFGLYEQGSMKLEREIASLNKEAEALSQKIVEATNRSEELALQVQSFSDPAWIELTLIRVLGVIPEGSTKVYYKEGSAP
jgi:hypothetical protein